MAKKKKKNKTLGIIIAVIILVIAVIGISVYVIANKKNPVPEGVIGNTSGNLNNRGLFCEYDGYVYFSNSYDHKKLYKMKADGTEAKRIADVPVEFINVYDKTIYFYQTPGADNQIFGLGGLYGVCYTDINGKSGMNLYDKAICNSLCLYGPKLYYQHYNAEQGLTLWAVDVNSGEKEAISEKEVLVTTPINGKFMTYNPEIGYYLSQFNPQTNQYELYDQDTRVYNVVTEGNYVYYMNIDDSYRIYRMDLSNYNKTKISDYKVEMFNIIGDYIYFQKSDPENPAIMRMKADGSELEEIDTGNYTNINCTSEYTYYYGFGDDSPIYRIANRPGASAEMFVP